MKAIYTKVILLLLAVLSIAGCDVTESEEVTGSGNLITIEENFTGFTEVKTGYAFESTITRDLDYSISVTLDDNLEKYLKVYKLGSILYVQMEDNNYNNADLKIEITMPDIEKIDLSGASVCDISGFNLTHDLEIVISGASNLTGSLNSEDLKISLSGASNLTLSGTGIDLIANGSGGSVIDLGSFSLSGNANLVLSGASVSTINLNGVLDIDLSGASVLYYAGEPTMGTIVLTGGSTMQEL